VVSTCLTVWSLTTSLEAKRLGDNEAILAGCWRDINVMAGLGVTGELTFNLFTW
jgi:hypothetical protein